MFTIVKKEKLNDSVTRMTIAAPLVAAKAQAGQFVILRAEENGERIPLTIADFDRINGEVTVIFQTVGATTAKLARKEEGEKIPDFVGPLGNPTKTDGIKNACVVGGGVGCAIALPVVKALKEMGANVCSVVGFRSGDLVILEEEFQKYSDEFYLTTDDGSKGKKGNVCLPIERLLKSGKNFDVVFTVGPLIMMKFVAETTKQYAVKTVASMNPIMIDGTGMCGGCRLRVGGKMQFACVDGPEFDAHQVDFDESMTRSRAYVSFEEREREKDCNLFKKAGR